MNCNRALPPFGHVSVCSAFGCLLQKRTSAGHFTTKARQDQAGNFDNANIRATEPGRTTSGE